MTQFGGHDWKCCKRHRRRRCSPLGAGVTTGGASSHRRLAPVCVKRFAEFSATVARLAREHSGRVAVYCPVNKISTRAWAGGDDGSIGPLAHGRETKPKHQLLRASLVAIDVTKTAEFRACFMQADLLVIVVARNAYEAHGVGAQSRSMSDSWLMFSGERWPGLDSEACCLDIVSPNFYPNNYWFLVRENVPRGHVSHRRLSGLDQRVPWRDGLVGLCGHAGATSSVRGAGQTTGAKTSAFR